MHADLIGAGLGEGLDVAFGFDNHQMGIEVGGWAEGAAEVRKHGHPKGDIGHKAAVHHVVVQAIAAGCECGCGVCAERGSIGREE